MLVAGPGLPMIGDRAAVLLPGAADRDGRRLTRAERQARPPSRDRAGRAAAAALRAVGDVLPRREERARRRRTRRCRWPGSRSPRWACSWPGYAAYRRVLDMPASQAIRRAGSFGGLWNRVIPGLSPAASAVAFTQLRLALRSPRGRATIGSPLLMPLVLAGARPTSRGGLPIPGVQGHYGLALAAMGCFAAILGADPALDEPVRDRQGRLHALHAVAVQHRRAASSARPSATR